MLVYEVYLFCGEIKLGVDLGFVFRGGVRIR